MYVCDLWWHSQVLDNLVFENNGSQRETSRNYVLPLLMPMPIAQS